MVVIIKRFYQNLQKLQILIFWMVGGSGFLEEPAIFADSSKRGVLGF